MTRTGPDSLLTTAEVAQLLQLHPKQVYRLVREGLPGRRVGGEWRFVHRDVIGWVARGGSAAPPSTTSASAETAPPMAERGPSPALATDAAPPFIAANGDVVVEELLALVNASRPVLGFVQSDRDHAMALLERREVLAAGSHGKGPPARLGGIRLARVHLVRREVGLVAAPGRKVPRLAELSRLRFAGRPSTAGVVMHLEHALREAGLDGKKLLARAQPMNSHRDVVCAVLRGDADVGLATRAWAHRVGLPFTRLADESYGLLVRALDLGDARVVRLCEVAQSGAYRARLEATPGYDATDAGVIRYDDEPAEPA